MGAILAAIGATALTALAALIGNLFLRIWQYRREHWIARAEACIQLVHEIADLAGEYWCDAGKESSESQRSKNEAKIIGLLTRLDGQFLAMDPYWDDVEREKLRNRLADFQNAVAGDEFLSAKQISVEVGGQRARLIHSRAADFTIDARSVIDDAINFSVWSRAWRKPLKTAPPVVTAQAARPLPPPTK